MELSDLIELTAVTPVIAEISPVSLCYLPDDVSVFHSVEDIIGLLDYPSPSVLGRVLIRTPSPLFRGRFPTVKCNHNPFTSQINEILFDKYDKIKESVLCQSQIKDRIAAEASTFDVVVILLIDGLSYTDTEDWFNSHESSVQIEPCLVDVPTITRIAFPNLIGSPSLATRLFEIGFYTRIGYSYWLREDNPLTDVLFSTIADVRKIGSFTELFADFRAMLSKNIERLSLLN